MRVTTPNRSTLNPEKVGPGLEDAPPTAHVEGGLAGALNAEGRRGLDRGARGAYFGLRAEGATLPGVTVTGKGAGVLGKRFGACGV